MEFYDPGRKKVQNTSNYCALLTTALCKEFFIYRYTSFFNSLCAFHLKSDVDTEKKSFSTQRVLVYDSHYRL